LAQRLAAAETELGRLAAEATQPAVDIVNPPMQLTERFQRLVGGLDGFMVRDPNRARAALREITGEIDVVLDEIGQHLVAKVGLNEMALIRAAGSSQKFMVAGVRSLNILLPLTVDFMQNPGRRPSACERVYK
jgi:hypothetical protein